jgi:hypothetical protein
MLHTLNLRGLFDCTFSDIWQKRYNFIDKRIEFVDYGSYDAESNDFFDKQQEMLPKQ